MTNARIEIGGRITPSQRSWLARLIADAEEYGDDWGQDGGPWREAAPIIEAIDARVRAAISSAKGAVRIQGYRGPKGGKHGERQPTAEARNG